VPGLIISVSRYFRYCFLLWACSLDRGAFEVLSFWNVPCPWPIAFSLGAQPRRNAISRRLMMFGNLVDSFRGIGSCLFHSD
jgi:hypothetical protein